MKTQVAAVVVGLNLLKQRINQKNKLIWRRTKFILIIITLLAKKKIKVIKTSKNKYITPLALNPKIAPTEGNRISSSQNPDLFVSWSLLTYRENNGIKKRKEKNKYTGPTPKPSISSNLITS